MIKRCWNSTEEDKIKKTHVKHGFFLKLSDQGSNLNSSEPKSDVLPITPSDNLSLWGVQR